MVNTTIKLIVEEPIFGMIIAYCIFFISITAYRRKREVQTPSKLNNSLYFFLILKINNNSKIIYNLDLFSNKL